MLFHVEQFRTRVFGMKPFQLTQEFLGSFIGCRRGDHLDLDHLIAARASFRRFNTLSTEAEFLAVVGPGGNLEDRATVEGGHFHACAEGRLSQGNRED